MQLNALFIFFFLMGFESALAGKLTDTEAQAECLKCFESEKGTITPKVPVSKIKGLSKNIAKQLAEADKKDGLDVVKVVTKPTVVTCTTARYDISPEVELKPNQAAYFEVPEEFKNRPVTLALLNHRQDPELPSNKGFKTGVYDTPPGRTSFQIFTENEAEGGAGEWRYYNNPSGGKKGSKFAAPSYEPEHETLFGWYKKGHGNANTDKIDYWEVKPKAIRLISVGKNPVLVSSITLQVAPPKIHSSEVTIFSPGTEFGKHVTEENQKFGGGQSKFGHFPDSIPLGYEDSPKDKAKLPKGWKKVGNKLIIPIPKGKILASVEVAAGDTHPDYDPKDPAAEKNEDGGFGTSGWSKMSLYRVKKDGTRETLVKNENVPPQGIISGSAKDCNAVSAEGETIEIEANGDTSYLMGVRLNFRNSTSKK